MSSNSVRLKFICRLGYGDSLPKGEEFAGDVPVFGSNGQYTTTSARNTDVPAIVLGRKGSYGKVNWAPVGCFASDTTFFVDECYVFRYLSRGLAIYPMVIQKDLENGFS
ncbi:hypothetical protein A6M23_12280 [Acidithiobacillus thiooxidans]|uniref:Type I restriction modification DNA specificity domain-containing protein n=1 Tax=Acidithiobacillus thiooxidans TaxID=930 RepID=A0A1C2I5D5_ACITH|nr:hypothetical protein A6M23_12280 [Acidithiobacillus thiooxidans]OCX80211.1 hypothetical protein A6P08_16710 [Acidithiobacillus thiooxidans]